MKLWGTHSMVLRDFPSWHFLTLFFKDSGKDSWIISITPAGLKPESFTNDSTIFGKRILWFLLTPMVARMYSSFAASSSWNTLLGVYTRTWTRPKIKRLIFHPVLHLELNHFYTTVTSYRIRIFVQTRCSIKFFLHTWNTNHALQIR